MIQSNVPHLIYLNLRNYILATWLVCDLYLMYLSCQWISKYTKLWIQYDGEKVFRAKTLAKMVIPDRNNLYMVIYIRLALYPWVATGTKCTWFFCRIVIFFLLFSLTSAQLFVGLVFLRICGEYLQ